MVHLVSELSFGYFVSSSNKAVLNGFAFKKTSQIKEEDE